MGKIEKMEKKRCLFCGKCLIDEKIPICLRCKLEGRNTAGKATEVISGIVVTVCGSKALLDKSKNNHV